MTFDGYLKTGKVSISTSTYVADCGVNFNLEIIFKNISVDNVLLGVKYENKKKGDIGGAGSFFNQMTARIYLKEYSKETSLKIFSNGRFQITGVKNEHHVSESIKEFLLRIPDINGEYTQEVFINEYGLVFHKQKYEEYKGNNENIFLSVPMYRKNNEGDDKYHVFGNRKPKSFSINKKRVVFCNELNCFIDEKHKNRKRFIYDNSSGKEIGYFEYEMLYNRKHLVLFKAKYEKTDDDSWDIINMYKTVSGKRRLVLYNKDYVLPVEKNEPIVSATIKVYYSCCDDVDFINSIKSKKIFENFMANINIETSNINSSFQIAMNGDLFDKSKLHEAITLSLDDNMIFSHYKSDTRYQAINFRMFFDKNMKIVDKKDSYNLKITATVFQTGKILLSGCRTKKHILLARKIILDSLSKEYENIIVSKKYESKYQLKSDISIWDL